MRLFSIVPACLVSLACLQPVHAVASCPDAAGPLMAVYRDESGLLKADSPTDNARVLVLWREGGANGRVAIETAQTGVTELWNRTINGQMRTVRLFDQYERAVEFEPSGSPDSSEMAWRQRFHLVDPALLKDITVSTATVPTVTASVAPLSGAGPDVSCHATRALRGQSGTTRTEVEWDESLQIPVTYVQSQWLATGLQQTRWKLVDWNDDATRIAQRFEQWDSYDSVDFADIGDNESDPFLSRMINLGFIEHGDNNFYDSQGRVLSGPAHRH